MMDMIQRFRIDWVVLQSPLFGGAYPTREEVESCNQRTFDDVKAMPDHLLGSVYVNPAHEGHAVEQVRRWIGEGMACVKLWIATECNDPRVFPVVETAIELRVPLLVHAYVKVAGNEPHESTPRDVADVADRYPEARFIMAHMGADWEYGLKAVRRCPNVLVDFAGSVNEKGAYETALALLGEERIVFGTDMPADYLNNLGRVLEAYRSETTRRKVLAENFEKLLPVRLTH